MFYNYSEDDVMNCNFKLDSSEFLNILSERFANDIDVSLKVTGNSMSPFLCEGRDTVFLEKFKGKVTKGDIMFYKRKDGKCILHRVVRIKDDKVWFIGDAQNYTEGPLSVDCIIAECNSAVRKGVRITKKNPCWMFFRYVWINLIPLRYYFIKIYSGIKKH
jgi:hypothetical protein